jgi:hypothetical protein
MNHFGELNLGQKMTLLITTNDGSTKKPKKLNVDKIFNQKKCNNGLITRKEHVSPIIWFHNHPYFDLLDTITLLAPKHISLEATFDLNRPPY